MRKKSMSKLTSKLVVMFSAVILSYAAVSYTHLDVYKRQLLRLLDWALDQQVRPVVVFIRLIEHLAAAQGQTVKCFNIRLI